MDSDKCWILQNIFVSARKKYRKVQYRELREVTMAIMSVYNVFTKFRRGLPCVCGESNFLVLDDRAISANLTKVT